MTNEPETYDYDEPEPATYSASWPPLVTWREASREIELHSLAFADFVADFGIHHYYKSRDVLAWLGY